MIEANVADDESVVGDECHIVSGKRLGPRPDPEFPADRLDLPENLVLLCKVHHKMVDDQEEKYTVLALRELKTSHENWVRTALGNRQRPRVHIRRIEENIPTHLTRLKSGKDVMKIIGDAYAYAFDHEDLESEAEVDLVGDFLQEAQDWGDLWRDFEAGERVRAAHRMTTLLRELEEAGFWVFGGREVQRLEGGEGPPSPWPVAILQVAQADSAEIIHVDLSERQAEAARSEGSGGPGESQKPEPPQNSDA